MKRLTTLLMTLMLMSTALWADETITVSANSSDISEGLDLKVVAKLFAEAKNLEQFETMLNNPDSAFCNLDLNGDGQVDYLRVVETGEGKKRLIVLQAILAKDIYQDVATIYVEKDDEDKVTVQVIGDEYIYGTNYIIEPVYLYRPYIYDWFWCDAWYAWHSPWYWGYYPGWWYAHRCWDHDWYWHHCYAWHHHHHHYCSFRPGHSVRNGYRELHSGVSRRDMAVAHPEQSFSRRNEGKTNAREIRNTTGVQTRQAFASGAGRSTASQRTGTSTNTAAQRTAATSSRTFGSTSTAASRSTSASQRTAAAQRTGSTATRTTSTSTASRSTASRSTSTAARSTSTASRSTSTASRSTSTSTRSTSTASRSTSTASRTTSTSTRSSGTSIRSGGGGISGGSRGGGGGSISRSGGSGSVRR